MEESRVCNKKDCLLHGVPQPIDEFYIQMSRGKPYRRKTCRTCMKRRAIEWERTEHEDDAPDDDLVPMEAGGFVRWAVLTGERREALGETSPFNGRSIGVEAEWN